MSSELQQLASRTNGAKSLGPVTEEGKQASSQNRRAHGLLSKRIVLPGESQEEFDELVNALLDEHQPQTPTELALIENMAAARWRQQRVWTLETAGLGNELRRTRSIEGEDFETKAWVAFRSVTGDSPALELLSRYEARFERQFRTALTALLSLRAKRRAEERADARAEAETSTTHVKYYWDDSKDDEDMAADSSVSKPTPSGSYGKNPIADISAWPRRDSSHTEDPAA
jgi:hypothetical protein